jgi:hypothetical protein
MRAMTDRAEKVADAMDSGNSLDEKLERLQELAEDPLPVLSLALFGHYPGAFIICNDQGEIVLANIEAKKVTGYPKLTGMTYGSLSRTMRDRRMNSMCGMMSSEPCSGPWA